MGPRKYYKLLHILLAALIITTILASFSFLAITAPPDMTGAASSILYNRSGLCGNNEVDVPENEECDNIEDDKCPGLCNNKICMCFSKAEKKTVSQTPYKQFYFFDRLAENESGTISFNKPGIGFTGARFTVNGTQKEFRIIIDTNTTTPKGMKEIEGGKVYQAFRIELSNISSINITSASVSFRVYKDWLDKNNFTAADITLRKHTDAYLQYHYEWAALKTELLGASEDYHSYTVKLDGFSYFAIVGEKPAICGNNACEAGENPINCCTDCGVRQANQYCANNTALEIKCGDNFCDTVNGESQATCCGDCGCPANEGCEFNACQTLILCGNNICEESETALNCAQDCGKKAFFSPAFILLVAGLLALSIFAAFALKKPGILTKRMPKALLGFASDEERLRERIRGLLGTASVAAIRETLAAEGWGKELIDKFLPEFRPEFEPLASKGFSLERHITEELAKKTASAVRSELLAKGWPAEKVDKILRRTILLRLAMRYGLHTEPRHKEKFAEFAMACRAMNCQPSEIKEIFTRLGWDERLIEHALKQIFRQVF